MNRPETDANGSKVQLAVVATATLLLAAEVVWLVLIGWWFARLW